MAQVAAAGIKPRSCPNTSCFRGQGSGQESNPAATARGLQRALQCAKCVGCLECLKSQGCLRCKWRWLFLEGLPCFQPLQSAWCHDGLACLQSRQCPDCLAFLGVNNCLECRQCLKCLECLSTMSAWSVDCVENVSASPGCLPCLERPHSLQALGSPRCLGCLCVSV